VSFNIFESDSLGIVGRNGAGKSSLLRLLGGIVKPDTGSIINNGYQTLLLSLQVGFDPQLSGRDNAILSGIYLGFTRREVEDRMDEIIRFSELEEFIDQPVRVYSSGMRTRLGFSVGIHLDPDILLVDEILAVGDAEFRKKSLEVMHSRLKSHHTVVLVSHQAQIIRELCNRAVWVEAGVTRAEGSASHVLAEYQAFSDSLKT
jgi:lipopolysaccharide transport system ATP-binding protein